MGGVVHIKRWGGVGFYDSHLDSNYNDPVLIGGHQGHQHGFTCSPDLIGPRFKLLNISLPAPFSQGGPQDMVNNMLPRKDAIGPKLQSQSSRGPNLRPIIVKKEEISKQGGIFEGICSLFYNGFSCI